MIKIDDYAYSSSVVNELPRNKLIFGFIPLVICLFANSFFASIITIALMAFMSVKNTKISYNKYLKLILIPFGFLIVGTITIIFSKYPIEHNVLFGFHIKSNVYGVDYVSLMYGLKLIFRALAAVSCMYFISLTTPMNDVLYSLQKIRVPKLIISLMELIYSYIFVLLDEASKMRIAQSSRLGYISFKTSIKSTGELIGMLFLRTYMRCDNIYSALESRGYTGELKTLEKEYQNNKNLINITVLNTVILILVTILERWLVK